MHWLEFDLMSAFEGGDGGPRMKGGFLYFNFGHLMTILAVVSSAFMILDRVDVSIGRLEQRVVAVESEQARVQSSLTEDRNARRHTDETLQNSIGQLNRDVGTLLGRVGGDIRRGDLGKQQNGGG